MSAVKYGIVITVVFEIMRCRLSQNIDEPMASFFCIDTVAIHSAGQYLRTYFIGNGLSNMFL